MNLKRVTITGADDSVSVPELVDLSAEFPFVEWGILVSRRQEGAFRFPTRHWIERLSDIVERNQMQISTHVCGAWVRQMFVGELDWRELPACVPVSQRVQINTHTEQHVSTTGLIRSLGRCNVGAVTPKEFIFQWDGVNDHLTMAAHGFGCKVAALFDTSGGAGVLPDSWPTPSDKFWCGYAGGLGPENVVEHVNKIDSVCAAPYWIDMERRVRSDDDSKLDMAKVRRVLELMAPVFARTNPTHG